MEILGCGFLKPALLYRLPRTAPLPHNTKKHLLGLATPPQVFIITILKKPQQTCRRFKFDWLF
ncbi:hypothetical protein [Campylobacter sp. 19-13652]|uniref:hypothetical protein n=1 Tax=Campylobacter sp. 19-13652 TaxID=2840180 RepID=UPI001C850618|nr:hypothetical protein [Campylobacter sp. 19-13652]